MKKFLLTILDIDFIYPAASTLESCSPGTWTFQVREFQLLKVEVLFPGIIQFNRQLTSVFIRLFLFEKSVVTQ